MNAPPFSIPFPEIRFPDSTGFYRGKVRDVHFFNQRLAVIATDRISAFDVVFPRGIPFKGQVLNRLACQALQDTSDILPNWIESTPHPMVSIGKRCEPIRLELVVRAYVAGHLLRLISSGSKSICGVPIPDGILPYGKLPAPIITPTTKAEAGHDEDISAEEILRKKILSEEQWQALSTKALEVFQRGSLLAAKRGLILADTKYEFGYHDGVLTLMDEIHTPDSSRFFLADDYKQALEERRSPRQLSKEFLREWLISQGFMGREGDAMPELTDDKITEVSARYEELFLELSGEELIKDPALYTEDALREAIASTLRLD